MSTKFLTLRELENALWAMNPPEDKFSLTVGERVYVGRLWWTQSFELIDKLAIKLTKRPHVDFRQRSHTLDDPPTLLITAQDLIDYTVTLDTLPKV